MQCRYRFLLFSCFVVLPIHPRTEGLSLYNSSSFSAPLELRDNVDSPQTETGYPSMFDEEFVNP
jgi:hypothetical protein